MTTRGSLERARPRARLAAAALAGATALALLGGCGDPPLPHQVRIVPIGHRELVLSADGAVLPRWIGSKKKIGFCLQAPLSTDTSQWRVKFRFDGKAPLKDDFEKPETRTGKALCFSQPPPPDLPSSRSIEVCGTVLDAFEDQRFALPCFRGVYDADPTVYNTAFYNSFEVVKRRSEIPREELITTLDRRAAEADDQEYPALALKLRLVTVHELREEGTPSALRDAERRLRDLPRWLEQPAAARSHTKVMTERAVLEMARGRRRQAWDLLSDAEDLARISGTAQWITIVHRQAEILSHLGVGEEPIRRLRAALNDCATEVWWCDPNLEPGARDQLSWLTLLDPDATAGDLQLAADHLDQTLTRSSVARDDREQANLLLNRAFLAARQGTDPAPTLAAARGLLEPLEPSLRQRTLLGWADVLEGLAVLETAALETAALETGATDRALATCGQAAEAAELPRLAGWAWSCLGQAHRQRGDLDSAGDAFDQTLMRDALRSPRQLKADLPLAPGRRADDYYRAARVAIERDQPQRAWQVLEAVDRLTMDVFTACEDKSEDVRQKVDHRRRELLDDLVFTEPPLAPERKRQLEPLRRSLLQSLEELHRTALVTCQKPARFNVAPAHFRAFALPDEVFLLERRNNGQVSLVRRTAWPRQDLRRQLDALTAARHEGRLDDHWRELARSLADALAPPIAERRSGAAVIFALHGVLQSVPLAALPVPTDQGTRWLGELITPVVRPAFVTAPTAPSAQSEPLFVVDPKLNLPSSSAARRAYREHFPAATILFGHGASAETVRAALSRALFLHIDTHGRYDAAFPQLSALAVSDGWLTLADFADLETPWRFANLSGCQTGNSARSGDSGRYGLAGALARQGVPWVIASRSDIEDRLGADFNRVFYREIALGRGAPEAYKTALTALTEHYPAAAWSSLLLLGAPMETDPEGKTDSDLTIGG